MSHTEEPWGYGIVRDGKQVGVERTMACALHWVDAEIVPLVPMQQRDELLSDAARLDWLNSKTNGATDSERYLPFRVYWGNGQGIRAAIDAAIASVKAKP